MGMQAIAGKDNVHWPLVLNIPGEGFGDDAITMYDNHRVLTDADDALFLLDEAYVRKLVFSKKAGNIASKSIGEKMWRINCARTRARSTVLDG